MATVRILRSLDRHAGVWAAAISLAVTGFGSARDTATAPTASARYFHAVRSLTVDPTRIAIFERVAGADVPSRLVKLGVAPESISRWPIRGWWIVALGEGRNAATATALLTGLAPHAAELFATPVFFEAPGFPLWPSPDVLIGAQTPMDLTRLSAELARHGAVEPLGPGPAGIVKTARLRTRGLDGYAVLELANRLADSGAVRFAEPDFVFVGRGAGVPSSSEEPNFASCWGLHNTGQAGGVADMDLDAPEAWDWTTGDPGIRVAVLDTGVQSDHPDLLVGGGADFTSDGGNGAPVNPLDNHGTAVAGCISARLGNGAGTVGIAPASRVASARVFIGLDSDAYWTSQASWTVNALAWALSSGARITNNSNDYGSLASAAIADAYADTRVAGLCHFASAGDDQRRRLTFPASIPCVNAVTAIDRTGALAVFSGGSPQSGPGASYGHGIDFAAPGKRILTTDRTGADGYSLTQDTVTLDGTSFASAYAAGAAALVLARNPWLTASDLEWRLQSTAADLGPAGYDVTFGFGLVKAAAAVKASTAVGAPRLVSRAPNGSPASGDCQDPTPSDDGRYVAFESIALNLTPGLLPGFANVFVHDRHSGLLLTVGVTPAGVPGNSAAHHPSMSGDGRYVAFHSYASDLVAGDVNGQNPDIFLRDLWTGTTAIVNKSSAGAQGTSGASQPNLSPDGRFVTFISSASNLGPGPPLTNVQVFVRDLLTGVTTMASVSDAGVFGNGNCFDPYVSSDGRFVCFESEAKNLTPGDSNNFRDIYVRDLLLSRTVLVSQTLTGIAGNGHSVFPSISGDGRYVVFDSNASNLVASDVNGAQADIFVRDLTTGVTTLVSRSSLGIQGNADSVQSSITPDGRYVCFTSIATNLVANDNNGTNDAFLRDLWTGTTELVAKNAQGAQGNLGTGLNYGSRSLTPDARFVAARSHCTNLVPGVSHSGVPHQIYVFDRQAGVAAAPNPWTCLGGGLTGAFGVPLLTATGIPGPGATITLGVNNASPSSVVTFIVGLTQADAPFFGGILVPSQDFTLAASADANGTTVQLFEWPPGLASGAPLYFQATVAPDPAAPQGVALSNAVKGIQP